MSYSPNVAYLACWGGGAGGTGSLQEAGAGPRFLLQNCFSCFPLLKPRCVLWSGASYSPKNMVTLWENYTEGPYSVCVCVLCIYIDIHTQMDIQSFILHKYLKDIIQFSCLFFVKI